MKKIWKQAAAILLAVVLVVGTAPIGTLPGKAASGLSLRASAATTSGKCGANVNWTLNTSTGVLSVTGTAQWRNIRTAPKSHGAPTVPRSKPSRSATACLVSEVMRSRTA